MSLARLKYLSIASISLEMNRNGFGVGMISTRGGSSGLIRRGSESCVTQAPSHGLGSVLLRVGSPKAQVSQTAKSMNSVARNSPLGTCRLLIVGLPSRSFPGDARRTF